MLAKKSQSGATLITALIMLIVLTLLVVSGIRASNTNLRIAGNMQMQEETVAAAQQAIEGVISNTTFTTSSAILTIPIDIDNNGTTDYTATVAAPVCASSVILEATDLRCPTGTGTTAGSGGSLIVGASGDPTQSRLLPCYKQTWDIQSTAVANDNIARVSVRQGVSLIVPETIALNPVTLAACN